MCVTLACTTAQRRLIGFRCGQYVGNWIRWMQHFRRDSHFLTAAHRWQAALSQITWISDLVGLLASIFGKSCTALLPSTLTGSTKGTSKFSRHTAPWMLTRPRPAVGLTARFKPLRTQPKAAFVWCSGVYGVNKIDRFIGG